MELGFLFEEGFQLVSWQLEVRGVSVCQLGQGSVWMKSENVLLNLLSEGSPLTIVSSFSLLSSPLHNLVVLVSGSRVQNGGFIVSKKYMYKHTSQCSKG